MSLTTLPIFVYDVDSHSKLLCGDTLFRPPAPVMPPVGDTNHLPGKALQGVINKISAVGERLYGSLGRPIPIPDPTFEEFESAIAEIDGYKQELGNLLRQAAFHCGGGIGNELDGNEPKELIARMEKYLSSPESIRRLIEFVNEPTTEVIYSENLVPLNPYQYNARRWEDKPGERKYGYSEVLALNEITTGQPERQIIGRAKIECDDQGGYNFHFECDDQGGNDFHLYN